MNHTHSLRAKPFSNECNRSSRQTSSNPRVLEHITQQNYPELRLVICPLAEAGVELKLGRSLLLHEVC